MDQAPRLQHIRLLQEAKRFLAAADDLAQQGGEGWRYPVPHYLAGHALELALKAHLSHQGASEGKVKQIGHDLETALAATDPSVLTAFSPAQLAAIKRLNPLHAGKQPEYPDASSENARLISVPSVSVLIPAAIRVVGHLDAVFRAENRARSRP